MMDKHYMDAIRVLKNNEKALMETVAMFAKYNALYYTELIRRGFSEEAALELTGAHGFALR